ncbi:MAG: Na(+)-translocating NADH-quinone reductase subunit C [Candidatus Ozemobacter sibiricus]|jgi:RnfABCDGE-type electron transport complex G subunit|uniref:Ion-translocating oxidoreductase complex subunit G n=1 Tax=Candidatus Ozemobacter sibiricus TaxID=2268124 RepID=A0A367ZTS3_9BACT|nr:MAG: Na(+)-translocating NADH-quinone reductase subunit C [Candidatus Ozemobacter sibiricus]
MTQTWRDLWFMLVLTTICTILLVVVEGIYQTRMATDPSLMRRALQLVGLPLGEDVRSTFEQTFTTVARKEYPGSFFIGKQNPAMIIRQEEGAGLWGKIILLVAYDLRRGAILGIDVLEHSETPGLGARIEEEKFRAQFRGLIARHGVRAAKIKFKEGEFDGVTGATLTSKAVEEIINAAIRKIKTVAGPGGTP